MTEGARADLVLVEGNPLEDVRHARRPAGLSTSSNTGRWVEAWSQCEDPWAPCDVPSDTDEHGCLIWETTRTYCCG